VVKVVTDRDGDAIYFSRLPFLFTGRGRSGAGLLQHIGLYVYQRDFLLGIRVAVGPLERAERLEQLRALETAFESGGGNEYESVEWIRKRLGAGDAIVRCYGREKRLTRRRGDTEKGQK